MRSLYRDLCGLGAIDDTPGITDEETNLVHYNHEVCHHPSVTGSVHDFGACHRQCLFRLRHLSLHVSTN